MAQLGVEFKATNNVSPVVNDIKKDIQSIGDTSDALEQVNRRFNQITNSTMPAKRQLRELQQIMTNMNLKGLTNTDVFTEIATKAGELKDAMADAQQATAAYANDTFQLKAVSEGLQGITAAGTIATGVMGLFGSENKKVAEILLKVQSAQAILNGVMVIANTLNKDSALMLKIKQVRMAAAAAMTTADTAATTANTVATGANTVATTANTVAQNAWNVSVAIGKALFGDFTGLAILAGAGLLAFGVAAATATDEQEDLNGELARGKSVQSAYYDEYNSNLSKTYGSYTQLQGAWKNLKTESEKNQWIKDNKDAFNELGFEINNTKDAETFFVQNESKVIASFTARAEAAALAAQQVELFNQALKDMPQVGESKSAKWFGENGLSTKGRKDTNQGFMRFEYQYEFTEEDRRTLIESRLSAAREASDKLAKLQLDAEKRANSAAAEAGVKTYNKKKDNLLKKGGKTTSKVEIKTDPNSLQAAEDQLKKLEEIRSKMSIDNPDLPKVKQSIEKLKKDIKDKKVKLGIEVETNIQKGSQADIDAKIKELEQKKVNLTINSAEWLNLDDQIQQLKDQLEAQTKGITISGIDLSGAFKGDFNKNIEGYKSAIDALEKSLKTKDLSPVNEVQIKAKIDAVKQEMNGLTPDNPDYLLLDKQLHKLEELQQKAAEGVQIRTMDLDGGKSFDEYTQKIKDYKTELEGLEQAFDQGVKSPAEQAKEKLDQFREKIGMIQDSISQMGNAFNTSAQAFKLMGDESTAAALQVVGAMSDMIAQVIPQIMALIGVKEGEAMASGTASAAALPFPANIAAIATIVATVISTFATIASVVGSFAQGGVVEGPLNHGDQLYAKVNAGEMILNNRQQKNLFNAIDNNHLGGNRGLDSGQVEFILQGDKLVGLIKNYNKIHKK